MNDLAERTFLPADQIAFAKLSGDHNPMHMDPVAARRTQAGHPVVHGVHAVLWALNAAGDHLTGFKSLSVRFERMIYVGDRCVLRQRQSRGEGFSLDILIDETVVTRIDLRPTVEGKRSSEHEKHSFAVAATPALFEEVLTVKVWIKELAKIDLALESVGTVVEAAQNFGSLNTCSLTVQVGARAKIDSFPISLDRSIGLKAIHVGPDEPAGILSVRFLEGWVLVSHQFTHADEFGDGFFIVKGGGAI